MRLHIQVSFLSLRRALLWQTASGVGMDFLFHSYKTRGCSPDSSVHARGGGRALSYSALLCVVRTEGARQGLRMRLRSPSRRRRRHGPRRQLNSWGSSQLHVAAAYTHTPHFFETTCCSCQLVFDRECQLFGAVSASHSKVDRGGGK